MAVNSNDLIPAQTERTIFSEENTGGLLWEGIAIL